MGARVLIVEDEQIIAQDLRETVRELGHDVTGVVDEGRLAIEHLAQHRVDLVLMDIKIRGNIDGIETAIRVRELYGTPVVFLTANTDPSVLERAKAAVPAAFLAKPFNETDLGSTIELGLFRSRLERSLRESEERYRLLADNLSDVIWTRDLGLDFTYISPSIERLTGFTTPEIMLGDALETLFRPESATAFREVLQHALEAGDREPGEPEQEHRLELEMVRKDGEGVWVEDRIRALRRADGQTTGFVGVTRDISERRRYQAELEAQRERFFLALEGTNEGIWDWNTTTNEVYFSPRWAEIVGSSTDELEATWDQWKRLIHAEDRDQVMAALSSYLEGGGEYFESEHRLLHRSGSYRWVQVRAKALRDEHGTPYRMVGAHQDVTERRLRHSGTDLPNQVSFRERLAEAMARSKEMPQRPWAILAIDIDQRIAIESSVGGAAWVDLLRRIGGHLNELNDRVCRDFGSEGFLAITDDLRFLALIESAHVDQVVREMLRRFSSPADVPIQSAGVDFDLSLSAGLVMGDAGWEPDSDAVQAASTALGVAKKKGPGSVEVYSSELQSQVEYQLRLESELRHSVDKQQLRLHYQPIIELATGRIAGFEALVRWQHPQEGLLGPQLFIPLAEESRMIVPMGAWILDEACRMSSQWRRVNGATPFVSVNLSAVQIHGADFPTQIEKVLHATGLAADGLKLEITETVVMEDIARSLQVLHRLRDLGVELAIDDFGTGYSSLSYLQQLPVGSLKIDRSFVSRVDAESDDSSDSVLFLRSIIGLADNLGMEVIAEGIETETQRQVLRDLGCRFAQGYLFGKPMTGDSTHQLLRKYQS